MINFTWNGLASVVPMILLRAKVASLYFSGPQTPGPRPTTRPQPVQNQAVWMVGKCACVCSSTCTSGGCSHLYTKLHLCKHRVHVLAVCTNEAAYACTRACHTKPYPLPPSPPGYQALLVSLFWLHGGRQKLAYINWSLTLNRLSFLQKWTAWFWTALKME